MDSACSTPLLKPVRGLCLRPLTVLIACYSHTSSATSVIQELGITGSIIAGTRGDKSMGTTMQAYGSLSRSQDMTQSTYKNEPPTVDPNTTRLIVERNAKG